MARNTNGLRKRHGGTRELGNHLPHGKRSSHHSSGYKVKPQHIIFVLIGVGKLTVFIL